jgi:excisionase family DNA binding protein
MSDRLLTARQVAEQLGVHVNTVKRMVDLPFVQIVSRGDRRYRQADVDEYVRQHTIRRRERRETGRWFGQ